MLDFLTAPVPAWLFILLLLLLLRAFARISQELNNLNNLLNSIDGQLADFDEVYAVSERLSQKHHAEAGLDGPP